MSQQEMTTLELLIRQEVAVKRLYETFAFMFPKHDEFWTSIAEEEQDHADKLARLRTNPAIEIWLIDEMQLLPETIRKTIAYVDQKREHALIDDITLQQAFSLAENIEKFLVDGVFSKLDQKPLANTPKAMLTLSSETKKHVELVAKKQTQLFHK